MVALLAPVGILALIEYYRRGEADLRVGGLVAAGFLAGSYFGARLATGLNEEIMRKGFAVFLVFTALWLFFRR